jgi:hypothetical protein
MSESLSHNIMHQLTHRRRLENKKYNFQLKTIDSEIRKANALQNMQRNAFLKSRTSRRNEWWNQDRHYREALRNAILTKGKHNNYLRSNNRSKSNGEETSRSDTTTIQSIEFEKENTSSLMSFFKSPSFVKEKSTNNGSMYKSKSSDNFFYRTDTKVKFDNTKLPNIDKMDDERLKFQMILNRFLNNTPFLVESRSIYCGNKNQKYLVLEKINKERKSTLARDDRYDNLLDSLANTKI